MTDFDVPSTADIHETHARVVEIFDLQFPGTKHPSPNLVLHGIINDVRDIESIWIAAATLLWRIARAHIYEDGNKRTAWLTATSFLDEHGYTTDPDSEEAEIVMRHIARFDIEELATWLETGQIDRDRFRDVN